VLKNSVQLTAEKYNYYSTLLSATGTTINAVYNVSKHDRVKHLQLSFNPLYFSGDDAVPDDLTVADENIFTARVDAKKSLLAYPQCNVPLPIRQIDIEVSGHVYSLTM